MKNGMPHVAVVPRVERVAEHTVSIDFRNFGYGSEALTREQVTIPAEVAVEFALDLLRAASQADALEKKALRKLAGLGPEA